MAKALRKGGLYKRGDQYVDADGKELPKKEVMKALSADEDEAGPAPGAEEQKSEGDASDLPEDFPGRAALIKAGHTNQADVDALDRDALIAVKGIGEATADEILALRD